MIGRFKPFKTLKLLNKVPKPVKIQESFMPKYTRIHHFVNRLHSVRHHNFKFPKINNSLRLNFKIK